MSAAISYLEFFNSFKKVILAQSVGSGSSGKETQVKLNVKYHCGMTVMINHVDTGQIQGPFCRAPLCQAYHLEMVLRTL